MKKTLIILLLISNLAIAQTDLFPTVAWRTYVRNVEMLTDSTYKFDVMPLDWNEAGASVMNYGNYFEDYAGNKYEVIDSAYLSVTVWDLFETGVSPQVDRIGVMYQSPDPESKYLAPIDYKYLDETALDNARAVELAYLWRHANLYAQDSANIVWWNDTIETIATKSDVPTLLTELDSTNFDIDTTQVRNLKTFVENNSGEASISGTEGYITKFGASGLTESKIRENGSIKIFDNSQEDLWNRIDIINRYPDNSNNKATMFILDQFGSFSIRNITGGNINFQSGTTTYLTGNGTSKSVGIGTTTPTEKLEVNGNIKADTVKTVGIQATGDVVFDLTSPEKFKINYAGTTIMESNAVFGSMIYYNAPWIFDAGRGTHPEQIPNIGQMMDSIDAVGGAVNSVNAGKLIDVSSTTGSVTVNVDLSEATSDNTFSSTDQLIYLSGTAAKKGYVSGLQSYMQNNLDFGSGGGMVYPSAGIPVSTGSSWGSSITNNSANWNTAYGWGDHSTEGYLTDAPSNGSLYGRKNGAWTVISTGTSAVTSVVAGNLVDVSSTTGDVTVNVDLSEATSDNTFSSTDQLVYLSGSTQKRGTLTGLESYMQSNLDFSGGTLNLQTVLNNGNSATNQTIELNDGGGSVYVGTGAGANDDKTGNYNVGIGYMALSANTTAIANTANGSYALRANTTGSNNTANGHSALYSNTNGNYNTANGRMALSYNTTGSSNTANGYDALVNNTTGSANTAIGSFAGKFLISGSNRTTGDYGVYIGTLSKSFANGTTNEIVIGYNAEGKGSNTAVIGNDNLNALYSSGQIVPVTQATAPSTPVEGGIYYNTTDKHFYGHNGTTWKQLDN